MPLKNTPSISNLICQGDILTVSYITKEDCILMIQFSIQQNSKDFKDIYTPLFSFAFLRVVPV